MTRRRRRRDDFEWSAYSSGSPIRVQSGIKAQSQRGRFVENWWGDRWIAALTRLMDSARLRRGRSYARQGQVLEIDVHPGHIAARVQGSRPRPYSVSIDLRPLDDQQWAAVLDMLAEQAIFAAQLLNGDMPDDIEQVFDAVGVPLFPESGDDLDTHCSCPDWANPCKHIAAVYYLLAEQFDQDPFLLFRLRGRSQDEISAALRERRAQERPGVREEMVPYEADAADLPQPADLAESVDDYWSLPDGTIQIALDIDHPPVVGAVFRRLGAPDFARGQGSWDQMIGVYADVTARALEVAFAKDQPG